MHVHAMTGREIVVPSKPLTPAEWQSLVTTLAESYKGGRNHSRVVSLPEPVADQFEAELYESIISLPLVLTNSDLAATWSEYPWPLLIAVDNITLPIPTRVSAWRLLAARRHYLVPISGYDMQRAKEALETLKPDMDAATTAAAYKKIVRDVGESVIRSQPRLTGRALHEEIRRQIVKALGAGHAGPSTRERNKEDALYHAKSLIISDTDGEELDLMDLLPDPAQDIDSCIERAHEEAEAEEIRARIEAARPHADRLLRERLSENGTRSEKQIDRDVDLLRRSQLALNQRGVTSAADRKALERAWERLESALRDRAAFFQWLHEANYFLSGLKLREEFITEMSRTLAGRSKPKPDWLYALTGEWPEFMRGV